MESTTENQEEKHGEAGTGGIIQIGHLLDYLQRVKDGRKGRGKRYRLEIILQSKALDRDYILSG